MGETAENLGVKSKGRKESNKQQKNARKLEKVEGEGSWETQTAGLTRPGPGSILLQTQVSRGASCSFQGHNGVHTERRDVERKCREHGLRVGTVYFVQLGSRT